MEIVNKSIRKLLTCLLAENGKRLEDWPYFLPVVQKILNERVTDKGFSAKEIFMGLSRFNPIHVIFAPGSVKDSIEEVVVDTPQIQAAIDELNERLQNIHREVEDTVQNRRDKERRLRDDKVLRIVHNRHHNSTGLSRHRTSPKRETQFYDGVNFEIGDFVLVAQAQKQKNRKLMANWRGPYRVS